MSTDSYEDTLKALHSSGDWQGVVQLYESGFCDEKLLWFQPSFSAIEFLRKSVTELQLQGVSSIGCGTGLLEWLISTSTGIRVIGYEIDQGWWESRYSPTKFWDNISCIDPTSPPNLNPGYALLFCYFNNYSAFEAYLDKFTGDCVILIGPDENNKNRYCDPQPFQLSKSTHWCIHDVWRSKCLEAIVVYKRSSNTL